MTHPDSRENKAEAKAGLGLEYKLNEALAVRGEVERYRINNAVSNRGDVGVASLSLVYKFGRPAARPYVAPPKPVVVDAAPAPSARPRLAPCWRSSKA